jgi:hypothetical protein
MANHQNIDFQDVLAMRDGLKRSTDLPLFYTDESKDIITSQRLVKGVEIAARITMCDKKRKGQELANILQGDAQSRWDSLDVFQTNIEDWPTVKARFLRSFELKHFAKTVKQP